MTNTMPDPTTDITGCLEALQEEHGDEWLFQLIGAMRKHTNAADDPVGEYRAMLARAMVDQEMQGSGTDEREAVKTVGVRLGYTPPTRVNGKQINTLTNFDKLVKGITKEGKPIGKAAE